MPLYGKSGRYGALAVITAGYRMKDSLPNRKIAPIAWLAVKFSKSMANNIDYDQKKKQIDAHFRYCYYNFMHSSYDNFTYLDRVPSDDRVHYMAAIRYHDNVDDFYPTLLYPVYDTYANKNGNKLSVFWIINAGGLLILVLILGLSAAHPGHDLTNRRIKTGG